MKCRESRKRSVKEIDFNHEDLLGSLRGHADHLEGNTKITMRVSKIVLPKPLKDIHAEEIAAIRRSLNVSQPVFAALLNVPLTTARSWEQGRRKPSGAALRLLDIARQRPKILLAAS
jgi:DNA-binding transcriptional regulator YiaG